MSADCVFCKIVRGEIPATIVYEDDATLAFLDIHPVNPGHTLVITKSPAARNILDVSPEDWAAVAETARKVARAVEAGTNADGVNIMMNNRSYAGQVVDHPHVHVIPRFKGDGHVHWPHRSYKDGEAATIADRIRSEFPAS